MLDGAPLAYENVQTSELSKAGNREKERTVVGFLGIGAGKEYSRRHAWDATAMTRCDNEDELHRILSPVILPFDIGLTLLISHPASIHLRSLILRSAPLASTWLCRTLFRMF